MKANAGSPLVSLLLALPLCAADAHKATIILLSNEPEYESTNTLPAFKRYLETNFALECIYLQGKATNNFPGLEALEKADLMILFARRMTLPSDQLEAFQKYVQSGRPLIGLRTASHAFQDWLAFDGEVLGGNYHNHYGNQLVATAKKNPEAANHPILKDVADEFVTGGSLYKTAPLASGTTLLLIGSVPGQAPEPMAWTHTYKGARVFYTSLGHPKDFENNSFRQMLVNAIFWGLGRSRN
jgi:type 1 glutamine amidotransferase